MAEYTPTIGYLSFVIIVFVLAGVIGWAAARGNYKRGYKRGWSDALDTYFRPRMQDWMDQQDQDFFAEHGYLD